MPGSYSRPPRARKPFVVTRYVPGADGRPVAVIPGCCPAQRAGCELAIHHHRRRKTGPELGVAVARCRTHGGPAFTLYPPAFAPYQRQPVLRLSPDGQPIQREAAASRKGFDGTIFEAAIDAEQGRAWQREAGPAERWWGTQCRQLQLAARLLGMAGTISDKLRESIAAALSVATLQLHEGARARGYRAIGKAVCSVLAKLRGGARRARQLLLCGFLIGQWGEPLHWDTERQVLERSVFSSSGTSRQAEPDRGTNRQRLGDMGRGSSGP